MLIKIDSRERKVIPFFSSSPVEVEVVNNMIIGDYAICYNDQVLHVFERKSGKDMAASIKSDNLHIKSMLEIKGETNCKLGYIFEYPNVFLEPDTKVGGKFGIPYKNISGFLDMIYIRHNIAPLRTKNKEGTANLIIALAQKYESAFDNGCDFNIKGGGEALVRRREKSDDEYILKMWMSMPGVGINVAKLLMCEYSFRSLYTCERDEIRILLVNGRQIGHRLDRCLELYQGPTCEVHQKLLLGINGLSKVKVNRVLSEVGFESLFENPIKDITINSRRIGEKISERVIKYLNTQH